MLSAMASQASSTVEADWRGEFQYGGPGELVERLVQQIVHAVEIVCHGAEGHVRLGGDDAMRGACHST